MRVLLPLVCFRSLPPEFLFSFSHKDGHKSGSSSEEKQYRQVGYQKYKSVYKEIADST